MYKLYFSYLDTVLLASYFYGIESELSVFPLKNIMSVNTWTKYEIHFNDTNFMLFKNDEMVIQYRTKKPILGYW